MPNKTFIIWLSLILLIIIAGLIVAGLPARRLDAFRSDLLSAPRSDRRLVFEEYWSKLSPAKMLDVLEKEYPLCHSEAHDLGKVIFASSHDLTESIAECRTRCSGGCFHGTLMEAFKDLVHKDEHGDDHLKLADLKDKMNDLCFSPELTQVERPGNCAHGVGHALTVLAFYNLDQALDYCRLFTHPSMQFYCTGGVFMEYDLVEGNNNQPTKSIHYPCDISAAHAAACYPYQAKHLLRQLGSSDALAQACLSLPHFYRLGCFRGLGFSALDKISRHPSLLAQICSQGTLADQKMCVDGAITKLTDFGDQVPLSACTSLTGEVRDYCLEIANYQMYSLDKPLDWFRP